MENIESQTKHWTKKTIMWAIGKKEKCVVKESIGNSIGKVADWFLTRSGCLTQELTAVLYDTLEGGMGWEVGKRFKRRHICILKGWFTLLYGRSQYNIVVLSSN